MHSTHTGHAWGGGVGGVVKIIVTTAHSPPSTPTGTENSVGQMLGTPVCDWRSGGGQWWVNGDKKFGAMPTEGGPVVPKGTLGVPVPPFQTTVWRYGDKWTTGRFKGNQNIDVRSYKKRGRGGRRGGEEVSRLTTTDVHRQHSSECKPPEVTFIPETYSAESFLLSKLCFCCLCSFSWICT